MTRYFIRIDYCTSSGWPQTSTRNGRAITAPDATDAIRQAREEFEGDRRRARSRILSITAVPEMTARSLFREPA